MSTDTVPSPAELTTAATLQLHLVTLEPQVELTTECIPNPRLLTLSIAADTFVLQLRSTWGGSGLRMTNLVPGGDAAFATARHPTPIRSSSVRARAFFLPRSRTGLRVFAVAYLYIPVHTQEASLPLSSSS